MTRGRKATIEDVAALARVSIKTVSRVVNKEPNVRGETREKVASAIARLRYTPNFSARRLAAKRTCILALLYDNPSASYLFKVQSGVLAACKAKGYDLLVHPCDHKSEAVAEEIASLCEQGRCDGLVLTPPLTDMETVTQALRSQDAPFVQIAPALPHDDYSWVTTTDEQAGFDIVRHLIDLGHRNIGFIQGHPDHKAMASREVGYRNALAAAGIKLNEQLIVSGHNSFESGEIAGGKLLGLENRPSAIFAANDDMAAGVMKAARDRGIAVPRHLSVAGFDDTPLATQIWPALTTIHQPIAEMAEKAAAILIDQLSDNLNLQTNKVVNARLIIRDSTGPAN